MRGWSPFAGGWPWDRVESARAAGRRLVRIPPSMRDAVVAALAEATSRLRRRPRHVVVKSVNSVFSLDWIVKRYTPKVLVLRRNPLNVVSSWVVLTPKGTTGSFVFAGTFQPNTSTLPGSDRGTDNGTAWVMNGPVVSVNR